MAIPKRERVRGKGKGGNGNLNIEMEEGEFVHRAEYERKCHFLTIEAPVLSFGSN